MNEHLGPGYLIRTDGMDLYVLLTGKDEPSEAFNGLRPIRIDLKTGTVTIGEGLTVGGPVTARSPQPDAKGEEVVTAEWVRDLLKQHET